jgi:hypothetical protein
MESSHTVCNKPEGSNGMLAGVHDVQQHYTSEAACNSQTQAAGAVTPSQAV